jgi:hypothetical protein
MSAIVDFLSEGVVSGDLIAHLDGVIEGIPHAPSRVQQLGLFSSEGLLNTTTVKFDKTSYGLELIQSSTRGTNAPKASKRTRDTVHFETVRIAKSVEITADEILNLRAVGSNAPEQWDRYFAQKSLPVIGSLRATREWHMLGAIKGLVLDADGTPLENLHTKMGTDAPAVVYFDLDAASPAPGAIRQACAGIVRQIADALGGVPHTGVHAFVGRAFMDKIANHPETRETFLNQAAAAELRGGTAFTTFAYGGIVFEEYRGLIGATKFVEDDEARFFPVGAQDLFKTYYGVADRFGFNEGLGAVEYAMPSEDDKSRVREVEYQSNLIAINKRPDTSIEGRAGVAPAPVV